ncbi:MAG: hypothetical protein HY579_01100 [Nitrospinae bacterium]|nr:hypothetical protein [Nitrospinota bacterium]
MSKGTILTAGFIVFIGALSYTLISTGSKFECEVCIRYNDRDSCQIVRGSERNDTVMQGVSTACGAVARGMTESIECQGTAPTKLECKSI